MSSQAPNHFAYLLCTKAINFSSDSFKIILMDSGFVFNKDSDIEYANVSDNELDTAFGYTVYTKACAVAAVTEDDTDDRCAVTFNNVSWTAAGGSIVASGAIIIDDTVANDPIVAYIDFGSDQTTLDAGVFTISNILIELTT